MSKNLRKTVLLLSVLVFARLACAQVDAAGALRLVATDGTTSASTFAIVDGKISASADNAGSGAASSVDATQWQLEGSLHDNRALLYFPPEYFIQRSFAFCSSPAAGSYVHGIVEVSRGTAWEDAALDGGILVFGWMSDHGSPAIVPVVASIAGKESHGFAGVAAFELTEEMQGGSPFALLWKNGAFVPPRPLFDDPVANEALALMHVGTAEEFRRAAGAMKSVNEVAPDLEASLLHLAAQGGCVEAVRALLDLKAAADEDSKRLRTPLFLAASNGRRDVVHELLAVHVRPGSRPASLPSGAPIFPPVDPTTQSNERISPFELAVGKGHIGVACDLWDDSSQGALDAFAQSAVAMGDTEGVAMLVAKRQEKRLKKISPALLRRNIQLGNADIVNALLKAGVKGEEGSDVSLLAIAATVGDPGCVEAVLDNGFAVDERPAGGLTPLMLSVECGKRDCVEVLLQRGADVKAVDADGRTALHHAVLAGNAAVAAVLIEHGSAIATRDNAGKTALDHALEMQSRDLVDLLVRSGARLDAGSPSFELDVENAIAVDASALIEDILKTGWKPASLGPQRWPALEVARFNGAHRVLDLLRAHSTGDKTKENREVIEKPDSPPTFASGERPKDTRVEENRPRAVVRVAGIVDTEGRFLFPRLASCPDPRLGLSALQSARAYRFRPAIKNGHPVNFRLELSLPFAARNETIWGASELSAPARIQTAKEAEPGFRMETDFTSTQTTLTHTRTVMVARRGPDGSTVYVPEEVIVNLPTPLRVDHMNRVASWAVAAVVVEPNGKSGAVQILSAEGNGFAKSAEQALAGYAFKPAMRDGVPVRSRTCVVVTAFP